MAPSDPGPSPLDFLEGDHTPENVARAQAVRNELTSRRLDELGRRETFACTRCGKFAFLAPLECYWCRGR